MNPAVWAKNNIRQFLPLAGQPLVATAESSNIESRAAAMLQQAERRCKVPDEPAQLLAGLLQEIRELPGCDAVTVWDFRRDSASPLLTVGTDGTHVRPSAKTCGTANLSASTDDATQYETANIESDADVVTGVRIVLAAVVGTEFPSDLLDMLADIMADLYRRELLPRLLRMSERQAGILSLVTSLNERFDRDRVINVFATDGAAVLNAKRISVATRAIGQAWRLAAATGVTDPELRSDAARALSQLVEESDSTIPATTADTDQPLPEDGGRSASRDPGTTVQPLSTDGEWAGAETAAVIEFGHPPSAADRNAADILCHHVSAALNNCRRFEDQRLAARLRTVARRLLARPSLALLVVLGLPLLWLLFGTAELRVEAFGKAVPVLRRHVFAPNDGIITEVAVSEQQHVRDGQLLCRIRNDELEILSERLQGDLSAAKTRLAALQTMSSSATTGVSAGGLPVSAEKEELKQRILGLEAQTVIVDAQINALTVASPISGTVHRERIAEALTGRPVRKGQLLLEIADESGPWELHLRVPESDIRHVFAAGNTNDEPLPVSFILESSPRDVNLTQLNSLADATELDENGRLSTLAIADLPLTVGDSELRPGSGVVAKIECGSARAGYVYFRRVIEFLQRRLLL